MTNMKNFKGKIYCFSPEVMLLTFLFETISAGIAFWKYKINDTAKLLIAVLLALAGFQMAEFMVCGGFGWKGVEWARFGYISITLLPPLGLHLAHKIAGVQSGKMVKIAYATMFAFIAYYVLATNGVSEEACRANYSVFNVPQITSWIYAVYYYGWLLYALYFGYQQISILKKQLSKKIFSKAELSKKISAIKWLMLGYLSFIVPTTFVNIVNPATIEGIPSIMCGFAVILAIILVGFVAPRTLELKKK